MLYFSEVNSSWVNPGIKPASGYLAKVASDTHSAALLEHSKYN